MYCLKGPRRRRRSEADAALVTRLLVASRNQKKLAELRRVLDAAALSGLALVSLDDVPPFDEAPETGATFEDNALAKARDGFAATGLPFGRLPSATNCRGRTWYSKEALMLARIKNCTPGVNRFRLVSKGAKYGVFVANARPLMRSAEEFT